MSKELRRTIDDILQNKDKNIKKTVTINLERDLIKKVDLIAKAFSSVNRTKNFSRNSIIEMALKNFCEEAESLLSEKYNININREIPDEKKGDLYFDLVTFPAREEEFNRVFIGEKTWYAVRISRAKLDKIKYVALYVGAPTSGITHYGIVESIKPYQGNPRKWQIYLKDKPLKLAKEVKLGNIDANAMRPPRYTTLEKLLAAKEISDLF